MLVFYAIAILFCIHAQYINKRRTQRRPYYDTIYRKSGNTQHKHKREPQQTSVWVTQIFIIDVVLTRDRY